MNLRYILFFLLGLFIIHFVYSQSDKFLVTGPYDSVKVIITKGDKQLTLQNGWSFNANKDDFLMGPSQSPLMKIPTIKQAIYRVEYGKRILNPFAIQQAKVLSLDEKLRFEKINLLFLSVFTGILFGMILFNILVYFSVKDRAYLYYILFILSFIILWLIIYGLGFKYLWSSLPTFQLKAPWYFIVIQTLFAFLFSLRYLNVENQYNSIVRFYFIIISLIIIVVTINNNELINMYISFLVESIFISIIFPLVYKKYKNNYEPSKYYMSAFIVLIISSIISLFGEIHFIEKTIYTQYATLMGASLMTIIFAGGLSQRLKLLQAEINNQQLKEEIIKSELKLRKLLLIESNHRIKNNLQLIYSLLNIQKKKINNDAVKEIFEDIQHRLKAMSNFHHLIVDIENNDLVDIIDLMKKVFVKYERIVEINYSCFQKQLYFPSKKSLSIILIINELLNNTIKHKLNENVKVDIIINKNNGKLELVYKDNGGLDNLNKIESNSSGIGVLLIDGLVNQLNAKKEITVNNGLEFKLILKDIEQ
jgi:two-component sensor histidine kinase